MANLEDFLSASLTPLARAVPSKKAERTAFRTVGKVTRRKVVNGVAPQTRAAHSRSRSVFDSKASFTGRITSGSPAMKAASVTAICEKTMRVPKALCRTDPTGPLIPRRRRRS